MTVVYTNLEVAKRWGKFPLKALKRKSAEAKKSDLIKKGKLTENLRFCFRACSAN